MQPYFDIHVCMISAQAAANYIPVIQKSFEPKKVIFIVSEGMKKRFGYLEELFKLQSIEIEQIPIPDVTNFTELKHIFSELLKQYSDENIALNVTGGNKLMAMAARDAFISADKPTFYLDTDNNRILLLPPNKQYQDAPYLTLNTKPKIADMLQAYGKNSRNNKANETSEDEINRYNAYITEIVEHANKYQDSLPLLNKYIANNKNNPEIKILSEDNGFKAFIQHIELLQKLGFLTFTNEKIPQFKINITKDMRFLAGGWLEYLVYEIISSEKLKDQVQDHALNLDIDTTTLKDMNNGKNNELDVIFLAKNMLHIIECKTTTNKKEITESLNKIKAIKSNLGLMTKSCLVSFFPLTKAQKNRAEDLGIKVIDAAKINQITKELKKWID